MKSQNKDTLGQLYFDLLKLSAMPKNELESIYNELIYKNEFGASIYNQAD